MIRLAWMGWRRIPWREGLLGCWIRARTPATGSARTRSCSRSQGWKIRFPSDRIIRIFEHQNSIKILAEFSKIITMFDYFSEILKISGLLKHFLECSAKFRKNNHQNLCKIRWKLSKNNDFCRNLSKNAKKVWWFFANILNLERCEGVQIL